MALNSTYAVTVTTKTPSFYDRYERKTELHHQTHYCPGCGHGIVHKLLAEASTDWACRTAPCSSARWAARSSPTTISMSATSRWPTAARPPSPRPSNAAARTAS